MARAVIQKTCGTGSREMTGVWLRAEEQGQGAGGVVLQGHLLQTKEEEKAKHQMCIDGAIKPGPPGAHGRMLR